MVMLFMKSSPAHDMAATQSAEAGASDAKRMSTSESLVACNDLNNDEMTMSQSRARARNYG
jgi:hypothetical protein